MKVLHVINDLSYGGAEKLLVDLLPELRRNGLDVELALLWDVPSAYKQRLLDAGIKLTIIGSSNYDFRNIFKLRKLMAGVDIVHAHLFPSFYLVALASKIMSNRVAKVVTDHNVLHKRTKHWLIRKIEVFIYRQYQANAAITVDVETSLVNRGVVASKIMVVPNGINLTKFLPVRKDGKSFRIGMAGRLKAPKSQATIIRTLPLLPAHISLDLAGLGEDMDALKELAKELKVEKRVNFIGFCEDMPGFFKGIDIHVFASRGEGFGLSAAESMAMGVPTIATDVQGLREVVGGGGVLFAENDEQDLANKIQRLYDDESYFREVSERGIVQAAQFGLDMMVDKYIALYNKVRL